ncbi:hypothetical protein L1987_25266 [Smallanthus sonchifolius]|uniref:Uncharacterized protein n=1 Tax=Smallanthus sonchifolius TaxID=185202 RepID=A0ACB9IMS5_9ASTR|nr:hypothetical protein L1987_25266 [Smallanthus sonchifolius]
MKEDAYTYKLILKFVLKQLKILCILAEKGLSSELGRYRDNVLKKCLVDRNKDQTFTELNIEKLQLVEAEKKKIQQEYVRKQRQIEVKKNI